MQKRVRSKDLSVSRCCAVVVLTLSFFITGVSAQQAVPAAGGEASGSGGSVSFSMGQINYTTHSGLQGSVFLGVQQPYEISIVSGFEENKIHLQFSIYPNPTSHFLVLSIGNNEGKELTCQIYDLHGGLIESIRILNSETSIDMSHLVPAIYFLRVLEGKKELKIFKIVKN